MSNGEYVNDGSRIKYTPGSDVTAGDVVVLSGLIGYANDDIAANEEGTLYIKGQVELPKVGATAWSQGDTLYWDESESELTNTSDSSANNQIGKAAEDAASAATTARVILIP